MKINVFWFRRDLRLEDNTAFNASLEEGLPVLPIFIFDQKILDELSNDDPRVQFIHEQLSNIDTVLRNKQDSFVHIFQGTPAAVFKEIFEQHDVQGLYFNRDYEPYALQRDAEIKAICSNFSVSVNDFSDQYIYEPGIILKTDGKPYTVFTPFKNKWLEHFDLKKIQPLKPTGKFHKRPAEYKFPSLKDIGFKPNKIKVKPFNLTAISDYDKTRNFPAKDFGSYLSPHLRFGTVSIRSIVKLTAEKNSVFLSELIWREFFMQILYFFPEVVNQSFKPKYDTIKWRNNPQEFEAWCNGETGYPMVDAGMRELNQTGYMHNRVRMVTASFLCKHLLIDWRWGEAYFAEKLLDFELASNNGNWQWAAGSGCDAAPYFRVFNPTIQYQKFDKNGEYVRKWVPEMDSLKYPPPMVDHKYARVRAIEKYKAAVNT